MSTRIRDIADRKVRESKIRATINLWLVRIPLIVWFAFACICGMLVKHDNFGVFLLTLGVTGIYVIPPILFVKIALMINEKLR